MSGSATVAGLLALLALLALRKAGTACCKRNRMCQDEQDPDDPVVEGCDGTSRFGLGRCRIAQRFAILFSFSFASCPTHSTASSLRSSSHRSWRCGMGREGCRRGRMWMHDGWVDARRGSEPGSVGPWVDVGLQAVECSPLDPTTHACLCCLCCPCRPGTPAPAPAPSLSAYVIGPSIWAGSVVIGGRAWGAGPAANQSGAFDSAASANDPGKTRAGATGSLRRRDDTTTLPAHADTAQKHTSTGPHSRLTACNQLPACSPLSQSQSQSLSVSIPNPSASAP